MGFKAKHQDGTTYWHNSPQDGWMDRTCGGTGYLNCYCGGDFCICGNFGEAECPGCEDCEGERGDDDDFEDDRPYPDDDESV